VAAPGPPVAPSSPEGASTATMGTPSRPRSRPNRLPTSPVRPVPRSASTTGRVPPRAAARPSSAFRSGRREPSGSTGATAARRRSRTEGSKNRASWTDRPARVGSARDESVAAVVPPPAKTTTRPRPAHEIFRHRATGRSMSAAPIPPGSRPGRRLRSARVSVHGGPGSGGALTTTAWVSQALHQPSPAEKSSRSVPPGFDVPALRGCRIPRESRNRSALRRGVLQRPAAPAHSARRAMASPERRPVEFAARVEPYARGERAQGALHEGAVRRSCCAAGSRRRWRSRRDVQPMATRPEHEGGDRQHAAPQPTSRTRPPGRLRSSGEGPAWWMGPGTEP
jgi:hypothetical protein